MPVSLLLNTLYIHGDRSSVISLTEVGLENRGVRKEHISPPRGKIHQSLEEPNERLPFSLVPHISSPFPFFLFLVRDSVNNELVALKLPASLLPRSLSALVFFPPLCLSLLESKVGSRMIKTSWTAARFVDESRSSFGFRDETGRAKSRHVRVRSDLETASWSSGAFAMPSRVCFVGYNAGLRCFYFLFFLEAANA